MQVLDALHDPHALDGVAHFEVRQEVLVVDDVAKHGVAPVQDVGLAGGQLRLLEQKEDLAGCAVGVELLGNEVRGLIQSSEPQL